MAMIHGRSQGRYCVRPRRELAVLGVALPIAILALAWPTHGWSLLLPCVYPIQIFRIFGGTATAGMEPGLAWHYGWTCTLARFPHALGLFRFARESLQGRTKTTVRDF